MSSNTKEFKQRSMPKLFLSGKKALCVYVFTYMHIYNNEIQPIREIKI